MSECPRFVSFNGSRLYHRVEDVEGVLDHGGGVTVLFKGGDSEVVLGWEKTEIMKRLHADDIVVDILSRSSGATDA